MSFCLLSSKSQHLQSANRIIIYGNSGSLIGWISFHTFTCTSNYVDSMCWNQTPPPPPTHTHTHTHHHHHRQRSRVFKVLAFPYLFTASPPVSTCSSVSTQTVQPASSRAPPAKVGQIHAMLSQTETDAALKKVLPVYDQHGTEQALQEVSQQCSR